VCRALLAGLFAAAFAEAFLAGGFHFAPAGPATFRVTFFATEAAVSAAVFVAFLADALTADLFLATGPSSGALAPLLSTKNASRFLAPAIQSGARLNPDQVAPVWESWYLAAPLLARLEEAGFLPTMAFSTADASRDTVEDRYSTVTPS
jgi:hypothetical protein